MDCRMPGFLSSYVLHCLPRVAGYLPMSFTISQSLLKLSPRVCSVSIESMMSSNHLILCQPLLLPSVFPSIRVFSNELVLCIRWLKYCSFSFSIIPSNEYSGLISFRIDWLDLLAVQGTCKSSLAAQFESINSLMLSLLYRPTLTSLHDYWKNHTFVYMDISWQGNVSAFYVLSRFLIAFLPRGIV